MSPIKQAKSQGDIVARNQNSIIDRMEEKKTLGEPRLSWGPFLLWPTSKQCMIMIQAALQVRGQGGIAQKQDKGLRDYLWT